MNTKLLISIGEVDTSKELGSFLDKITYGGSMVLIGMLAVFSVLVIIMLSLFAFKFFFHDLPSKQKATQKPIASTVSVPVKTVASDEEEVVAAITAAITLAESESDGVKFRVVSFKRR